MFHSLEEAAPFMAMYFGDQLRGHVVHKITGDNPERLEELTEIMMNSLALSNRAKYSETNIQTFEENLTKLIIQRQMYGIFVDYDPDEIIYDAGRLSGLAFPKFTFSAKSGIRYEGTRILVKRGYGANFKPLF